MNKVEIGTQTKTNNCFRQGKFYVYRDGEVFIVARTHTGLHLTALDCGNRWMEEDFSKRYPEDEGFTEVATGTKLTITVGD